MQEFQDAFISYGRLDSKVFATNLQQQLLDQGLKIWFDNNDIPLGVDFQNQIDDGLEKSDNFLFIISPHAVNSPYCGKEIELAIRREKRIVPVLHVEQITQATWEQRNPGRALSEWEEYKAKGLHSSFPNMHPAIGKINWVYFREGIDDPAIALKGLISIFERERDFVRQHTVYLAKGLEWERNQKQSRYLLTGDDRIAAETWLKRRFQDEQPPCIPTDLHCAFICESIKNANNLMTNVFISYSEKERAVMAKIANSLMRQGLTVWTNKSDIKTGTDFGEMIDRGIEEADNIVFLLSPNALTSEYCQKELAHARLFNKRIIPLLIAPTEPEQVPSELRMLQFIDMVDYANAAEYQADFAKLLRVLREDEVYFAQHKILLAKALKWERQKRNPSILLRGYNLRQAEAWLKATNQRTEYLPTPLHKEFLAESLKQPPEAELDVFISYSQADADFARKINDGLQIQGTTTWFDQESIASGTDFQQEIFRGIERCSNFLFILSPNSVNSPYCAGEVEYAAKLNKRCVSVLYREVGNEDVHPILAGLQWIDFRRHDGDFFINFGDLVRTLATDPEYVRNHTRLLLKAIEWEREGRDDSYLLRGKELVVATEWMQQTTGKEPQPTDVQRQYLTVSQALPFRKIKVRNVLFASLTVTAIAAIARFLGLMQPVELVAYDHLLRLRPDEAVDNRFLIVGVDQPSIEMFDRSERYRFGRGTIPDLALSDTLKILNQSQPKLIGLDFFRDFIALPELTTTMQQTPNLIGICKNSATDEQGNLITGTKPPPTLPIANVGFANLVDDGGTFLRRQYLMAGADQEFCDTPEAFSLVLTRKYLETQGKAYQSPYDPKLDDYVPPMKFGNIAVPPLWGDGSGYRDRGFQLGGYQTLLKYRTVQGDPAKFAPMFTLKQVLENKVPAELIRDRIVLIGIVDKSDRQADYWNTPYGSIPGVVLQGQMVSQLVSATLDGRALIWWLPLWVETGWMLGWSLVGGGVVWWFRRSGRLTGAIVASVVVLYGICYVTFVSHSGWLPLAPALITLAATGAGVAVLNYRSQKL